MRDPYKFLNVPYDVTAPALKARYVEFAKKLHADSGGSDEMMKLINEARDQIRFNIENGITFDPRSAEAPPQEPEPRPEEEPKHDTGRSRSSRDDPPEEPSPQWGTGQYAWDIGGGSYRTAGTYSNRPYSSPGRKWLAGGVCAFLIVIMVVATGSGPVATTVRAPQVAAPSGNEGKSFAYAPRSGEVAPPPPALAEGEYPPDSVNEVEGYIAVRSPGEIYQIDTGQPYGLDLLPGISSIVILSGQVEFVSPDGKPARACSAAPVSFTITNPVSPASFYLEKCVDGPVLIKVTSSPIAYTEARAPADAIRPPGYMSPVPR